MRTHSTFCDYTTLLYKSDWVFCGPECWIVRKISCGGRVVLASLTEPIFDHVVTIVAESQTRVGVVVVVGWGGDDSGSILPLFINSFKSKAILITSTFSPFYCECKWKKGCRMHKIQSMASLLFAQSHYLSLPNAHSLKQCLQFIKQLLFECKLKTN